MTGATWRGAAVRVRWCGEGWRGCANDSTHTGIIDRLEPSGEDEDGCEGSKFWLQVSRSA